MLLFNLKFDMSKQKTITKVVNPDSFIRVYLSDFGGLLQLKGVEYQVLYWMFVNSKWNNEPLVIDTIVKEEIAKEINRKIQSVSDAMSRLVSKKIIIRDKRIRYSLNPLYFFKGDDIKRGEILKMMVEYKVE